MSLNNNQQPNTDVSGQEPVAGVQGKVGGDKKDFANQPDTSASTRHGPSEAVSGPETGDPNSAQNSGADGNHQGTGQPRDEHKDQKYDQKNVPHTDEEREKAMEKGNFPHDPNDHSGEPLEMHELGGNVQEEDGKIVRHGGEGVGQSAEQKQEGGQYDRKNSVAHEGGGTHGKKEGTGTEYVKSSGMAAEGGDFDASNPGAGAEANRLLEKKGIHKDGGNSGPPQKVEGEELSTGKVSTMDKIKDKLHMSHSGKKEMDGPDASKGVEKPTAMIK